MTAEVGRAQLRPSARRGDGDAVAALGRVALGDGVRARPVYEVRRGMEFHLGGGGQGLISTVAAITVIPRNTFRS